jgi:hypothetical protein
MLARNPFPTDFTGPAKWFQEGIGIWDSSDTAVSPPRVNPNSLQSVKTLLRD